MCQCVWSDSSTGSRACLHASAAAVSVLQLEEASRRHKEATHCEEGEEALLNAMKEEVQV